MAYRLFRYILFFAVLIFSWQACDNEDPSVNASRLRLKLTDAASVAMRDFFVDIREISVFLMDTVTHEGEWITLEFPGKTYDILKLMNGKMVQMVDQYVPAGTELQQIKLMFGNDNRLVVITDSIETIPLRLPPGLEDGLVIDAVKMELRQNTISSMVIDLNAALSVLITQDGDYFFYPVARAFPETYGGKLRGYVAPLNASPLVAIVQDEDTLYAIPERDPPNDLNSDIGMFQFIGLKEGEWEIHLTPRSESNYRDTVFNMTVEDGKVADIPLKPVRLKLIPGE